MKKFTFCPAQNVAWSWKKSIRWYTYNLWILPKSFSFHHFVQTLATYCLLLFSIQRLCRSVPSCCEMWEHKISYFQIMLQFNSCNVYPQTTLYVCLYVIQCVVFSQKPIQKWNIGKHLFNLRSVHNIICF